MAIASSHKSQFRQWELPAPNTYHVFLENEPLSNFQEKTYMSI